MHVVLIVLFYQYFLLLIIGFIGLRDAWRVGKAVQFSEIICESSDLTNGFKDSKFEDNI